MVLAEMSSADFGVLWSYPAENHGTSPKAKTTVACDSEEAPVIPSIIPAKSTRLWVRPDKPG